MPNVLPLPIMLVQVLDAGQFSITERGHGEGVSVTAKVPALSVNSCAKCQHSIRNWERSGTSRSSTVGAVCTSERSASAGVDKLNNYELGRKPVRLLLIRSLLTDKETSPLGVIRQEQQETNCSSGENA